MVAPDAWGAPPFFEGRGSVRHPAIDRRVVNGKTSFSQHFGQIAGAQGVTYHRIHKRMIADAYCRRVEGVSVAKLTPSLLLFPPPDYSNSLPRFLQQRRHNSVGCRSRYPCRFRTKTPCATTWRNLAMRPARAATGARIVT
jgi:hypothetical protein